MPITGFKYSEQALEVTMEMEACRLNAYQDSGGVWTIGWGHTGPEVVKGLVWTREQCVEALKADIAKVS